MTDFIICGGEVQRVDQSKRAIQGCKCMECKYINHPWEYNTDWEGTCVQLPGFQTPDPQFGCIYGEVDDG